MYEVAVAAYEVGVAALLIGGISLVYVLMLWTETRMSRKSQRSA